MKRAKVAEEFGLDIEFHAPGPAQRQCIAAIHNTTYYELVLIHPDCLNTQPPAYKGDYSDMMDAIDDGMVTVLGGPGLGVDYDRDYIMDNQIGSVHVYE